MRSARSPSFCRRYNKNGDLWLGKLCADLQDSTLYKEIKGESPATVHSVEVVQDYAVLQKAIDYAADKPTAERLLAYVYEQLEKCIGKPALSPADEETIFNLYKLCGDYNSENAQKMRVLLSRNTQKLARARADELLDYLFSRISDVNELIPALEKAVTVYLERGQFTKAEYFNARIQDLDESNSNALMNAFYIANRCKGKIALLASAENATDFSVLEKGLPKIVKASAEKIILLLCEVEKDMLRHDIFAAAEKYFTFIVKYDFTGRENFLRSHVEFLDAFVANKSISFYEKLLSVYPDRSTEFHLKSRLAFADKLLSKGYFSEAEAMYKKALELDSENGAALQGLLYGSLKMRGEEGDDPQWQNWDQALFERILAACPNKKAQSDLVNKMCKLCIESMKKAGQGGGKSPSWNGSGEKPTGLIYDGAEYDYDDDYYKMGF